jgi:flagellar FliL protein
MSAAAAVNGSDGKASSAKGRKKLIVIIAVAVLAAAGAGGGGMLFLQKKKAEAAAAAADEASEDDGEAAPDAHAGEALKEKEKEKDAHSGPPTFLPLDPFIVNLTDRDAERYAQIGITLELGDAKSGDQLKAYMPAIRNGILMAIAQKSSQELLSRAGKEKLADEIMREAVRPLGITMPEAGKVETAGEKRSRKAQSQQEEIPVRRVHFSSFIIQ